VFHKKTAVFFGLFLLGLVAAVPLRTCAILFDIDPKTGFYYGGSGLVTALNILLIAVTVLLLAPMVMKSYKGFAAEPGPSVVTGILSAVVAAFFCIDGAHEFYILTVQATGAGTFFNSMLEFIAAVFFVMMAVSSLKGGRIAFPAASLLPVIWATIHLMVAFMHYTTVVNVSEYLFDMLKMVFVMIFFYYHARYTGRVANGREIRGMLAFGLPAAFFSLLSILPRYLALAFGHTATINLSDDLLYLTLAIYILNCLVHIFSAKRARQPASPAAV
jgi:hypothetical protein